MSEPTPKPMRHRLVIGLAGFSGAGKTTLTEQLIPLLVAKGFNIATIKHAHHNFDADIEGKDSWRHRQAGASQVLVSSKKRRAHFTETANEASLDTLLTELAPSDIVLVEGFKNDPIPKIELRRQGMGRQDTDSPALYKKNPHILAVATDSKIADCPLPQFDINDPKAIADFIADMVQP